MFWSGKIDLVKKKFPMADFKDPFRAGAIIIEKIIVQLFGSTWLNFLESENKVALLKHAIYIKTCSVKQLYNDELPHLDRDQNFWLLIMKPPMGPNIQVYDCKYEPSRTALLVVRTK